MQGDTSWAARTTNQQSRTILAPFSTVIIAELGNHCYFHYLVNLVDLDRV